jgi:hypothetical protein
MLWAEPVISGGVPLAKRTNGPDWTDVALHLSAIGALHGCRVALTVIADTQGHNGLLDLTLSASFELLPGSAEPVEVNVKAKWPTVEGVTVSGRVLALAVELDWKISETYKQVRILEEA